MKFHPGLVAGFLVALGPVLSARPALAQDGFAVDLPAGVRAVWDLGLAYRETTATRERVCLNGLWRWQPAASFPIESSPSLPAGNWGYFKVPGCWPGITDYMQKDCQQVFPNPAWKDPGLGQIRAAWYEREFTVPQTWANRRIALSLEYVNSLASVFVDGKSAGEIRFPGGEIDLTAWCRPGAKHRLTLGVLALPLKGVMLSYADTAGAKSAPGTVERRGLCGDAFLSATPRGARITNVKIDTSVRTWELSLETALEGLDPDLSYELRAEIRDGNRTVKELSSGLFRAVDLKSGRHTFRSPWKPDKLWDTHTPENQYELRVALHDQRPGLSDAAFPQRFGFREFWINGRDFYLNGTRILLCAVPLDNAQIGAAWASYAGARESLRRLKSFGINFVYTHNYGCEPGTHLGFGEILRAADDEGVLVSFSQPHFAAYDWKAPGAATTNGYAQHAAFYVRAAGNHPSVVCYSMSHNACGTEESMNPDLIGGREDPRNQWAANNAKLALRAEALVRALDPGRIVYHHSSGNLGVMHTANFYANFVPVQEMSDWFLAWSEHGVKPVFLCEYGVPISWDWMMYRGWHNGAREFGSARVPWELCMAEWNAQFLGDRSFDLTDLEKECARWEARQFRSGQGWCRWDYPRNAVEFPGFERRNQIFAEYLTDNIRAFRTLGLSAFCPWDHGIFWRLREGVERRRKPLPVDWDRLQQPGFSPDYIDDQMAWMNTSFDRADWLPTSAAEALYRNNLPLLAYIAGGPAAVTGKDHNYLAGETVEKQIVILNNSRRLVTAEYEWSVALPQPLSGKGAARIGTGQDVRIPLGFTLPAGTAPGPYPLTANIRFPDGTTQRDIFTIDVLRSNPGRTPGKIALFDPQGETAALLAQLGIDCVPVAVGADTSGFDVLIVGRGALDTNSASPDVSRLRQGLRVIFFEQTAAALERRFGFRIAEYGLRRAFERVPGHPFLAGLSETHLHDWRGESTLLPPRLPYTIGSRHAPEVQWCGLPVTRLWRAGNRGSVASVLIEKPARGDFLPIVDGGFGLQYSPLLLYREGAGAAVFCQLDVTARTQPDPAAFQLVHNLVNSMLAWKPEPRRQVVFAGDPVLRQHLERAGFSPTPFEAATLPPDRVLVVGPGGAPQLAPAKARIADFAKSGGRVLCLGLDQAQINAFLPLNRVTETREHISAWFEPFPHGSPLCGVSPGEVLNREPQAIPLATSGATVFGNGVLAFSDPGILFSQLCPTRFSEGDRSNLRRTYRRVAFLTTRLLANLGATSSTPVVERCASPPGPNEKRWLEGFYLDTPQEWDDPYRFFCW